MNEKFWDMKKEKQDRIMNAAIGVFAEQGYAHASTDEIVKRAGISKGLLFHYFISKPGLYEFLYGYFSRFMRLELSGAAGRSGESFFDRCIAIERAKGKAMKQYPYIQCFLSGAEHEDASLIGGDFEAQRAEYAAFCRGLYPAPEECGLDIAEHYQDWMNLVFDVSQGAMKRNMINGELHTKAYLDEIVRLYGLIGR